MPSPLALSAALVCAAAVQDPARLTLLSESVPLRGPARRVFVAPDGAHVATLGTDGGWCVQALAAASPAANVARTWRSDVEAREGDPVGFSRDGRFVAWVAEGGAAQRRGARGAAALDLASGEEVTLRALAEAALRGTSFRLDAAGDTDARLVATTSWRRGTSPGAALGVGRVGPTATEVDRLTAPVTSDVGWWTSGDAASLAVAETSGTSDRGRRIRRADVIVVSLVDGREVTRGALEDEVSEADPWFPDGLAVDVVGQLVARVSAGRVHLARLDAPGTARAVFGGDVTVIAADGEGGWLVGTRHGAVESWRSEARDDAPVLRERVELGIGAVEWLGREAGALAARGARGRAVRVGAEAPRRVSAAAEAVAAGPYGVLRDGEGALTVVRAGGRTLRLDSDRPEYDDADERCVRVALAGDSLAWLVDGAPRVLDLSREDAEPRELPSLHAGRIEDLAWRGDGLALRGPLGWEALGGVSPEDPSPRSLRESDDDGDTLRAFSPDRALVAAAWEGQGHTTLSFGPVEPGAARSFTLELDGAPSVRELAVAPGGRFVGAAVGGFVLGAASEGALYFDAAGRLVGNDPAGPTRGGGSRHTGSFGFSSDGRYAVAARFDRRVTVRDLEASAVALRYEVPHEAYSHFAEVAAAPDGPWYVLSYPERRLLYVGAFPGAHGDGGLLAGGRIAAVARGVGGWSDGRFDFLPGDRLVTLEAEGVTVRRLPGLEVAARLDVPAGFVRVSPDGRRLALADGAVLRVVDVGR